MARVVYRKKNPNPDPHKVVGPHPVETSITTLFFRKYIVEMWKELRAGLPFCFADRRRRFFLSVVGVGRLYGLDVEIRCAGPGYQAFLSFDGTMQTNCLIPVIAQADRISFVPGFNNRAITLLLECSGIPIDTNL